jgi:hypothetical protein
MTRDQERLRRALFDKLAKEKRLTENSDSIKVGDWVVHPLGKYEKGFATHPASTSHAMCPSMSLPSKVLEVKGESLSVAVLGSPDKARDVSRSVCRVLKTDVPPTLQELAWEVMRYEVPMVPASSNLRRNLRSSGKRTWSQIASDVTDGKLGESKPSEVDFAVMSPFCTIQRD